MTERQVRNTGRPIYGRSSMTPPRRQGRRVVSPLGSTTKRLIILVVIVFVCLVMIKQFFAIKTVDVKSTTRTAEIQLAAIKAVSGSFWQDNLITFNSDALATKMRLADPMISSIDVRRKWPNKITLGVTLKQPSIGWSSGNQSYLIDVDGTAIGVLPQGSGLPVVVDGSNLPVTVGKRVVSTKFVSYIQEVVPALTATGLKASQLQVKDTTYDLYVVTDKSYYLIFDTGRPVGETVADLKLVLATLSTQKRTPAEYIDLRIPDKAYYK